jgi:hypothetical protein
MTREARLMSGIIFITVPTIRYGGYFLLGSLMSKRSGYMENPLRQNFFRAGHAPSQPVSTRLEFSTRKAILSTVGSQGAQRGRGTYEKGLLGGCVQVDFG